MHPITSTSQWLSAVTNEITKRSFFFSFAPQSIPLQHDLRSFWDGGTGRGWWVARLSRCRPGGQTEGEEMKEKRGEGKPCSWLLRSCNSITLAGWCNRRGRCGRLRPDLSWQGSAAGEGWQRRWPRWGLTWKPWSCQSYRRGNRREGARSYLLQVSLHWQRPPPPLRGRGSACGLPGKDRGRPGSPIGRRRWVWSRRGGTWSGPPTSTSSSSSAWWPGQRGASRSMLSSLTCSRRMQFHPLQWPGCSWPASPRANPHNLVLRVICQIQGQVLQGGHSWLPE